MSVYTGQFGVLKVADASATLQSVAELRSFSIETTTETIENTTMGDNSRNYFAGLKSFSGTADIFYDDSQLETSGANDIPAFLGGVNQSGASPRVDHVAFEAYPNGATSGNPKINGSIIITGYSITSSLDGMVEASISFTGTGDITLNASAS